MHGKPAYKTTEKRDRLFFLLLYLLGFGMNQSGLAQADTCNTSLNGNYLKSYYHAGIFTIRQPASLSTNQWILAATGAAAILWTYSHDQVFYDQLHNPQAAMPPASSLLAEGWGSGLTALPVLAGMYMIGHKNDNPQLRHATLAGLQAFVISAGAAWTLKQLSQRPRPDQYADPGIWHGPFDRMNYDAFPSGHTMRAFALATVLAGVYEDRPAWGLVFYGLAGITAFSRLQSGEHWPSDVVAGALLGFGMGRAVLAFNREKSRHCLQASFSANGLGILYKIQ